MARIRTNAALVGLMAAADVGTVELAANAQCSAGFISALRTGRKVTCSDELAERIAERLGVPLSVLFDAPAASSDMYTANSSAAA